MRGCEGAPPGSRKTRAAADNAAVGAGDVETATRPTSVAAEGEERARDGTAAREDRGSGRSLVWAFLQMTGI